MKKIKTFLTFLVLAASAAMPSLRAREPGASDPFALMGEKLAKAMPRVEEGKQAARFLTEGGMNRLQVPRFEYTGPGGAKVELVGAIHIADRSFYERLNAHFESFEAVLFEMVANPDQVEALRKKADPAAHAPVPKKENPLRELYQVLSNDILKMPFQAEVINYGAANFIHADVSEDGLRRIFEEKGLDMDKSLTGGISRFQLRAVLGLAKLLTPADDPCALKRMFAPVFGSIGGFGGRKEVEEIIVGRRNDRAMEVLKRELAAGRKHLALFYGSAHLADFRERLEAKGWTRTGEFWEDAWSFPASKGQPAPIERDPAAAAQSE